MLSLDHPKITLGRPDRPKSCQLGPTTLVDDRHCTINGAKHGPPGLWELFVAIDVAQSAVMF